MLYIVNFQIDMELLLLEDFQTARGKAEMGLGQN
jgi:hypothetical protein